MPEPKPLVGTFRITRRTDEGDPAKAAYLQRLAAMTRRPGKPKKKGRTDG